MEYVFREMFSIFMVKSPNENLFLNCKNNSKIFFCFKPACSSSPSSGSCAPSRSCSTSTGSTRTRSRMSSRPESRLESHPVLARRFEERNLKSKQTFPTDRFIEIFFFQFSKYLIQHLSAEHIFID